MPPHTFSDGPKGKRTIPLRIEAMGSFLPSRRVTAEEIDALCGRPAGWTMRHTGVAERRFVGEETTSELAAGALRAALAEGGGEAPDLLLSAGGTTQQPIPCTAALVAREMAWSGVPCYDVNATCLGFVVALDLAASLIASGRHRRIAIVCAEIASKGLNWSQAEAAALMGDGAAAAIVSGDGSDGNEESALLACSLETWPDGAALTEIRGGGTALPATRFVKGENDADFLFHMDGPEVFRLAAERIEAFVAKLVGTEANRWEGLDLVVPHQGSLLAMQHLRRRLGIPPDKLVEIAHDRGNVIAASLPLALHEAIRSGRLRRGQRVMLLGTSAGFSIGGAVLRY